MKFEAMGPSVLNINDRAMSTTMTIIAILRVRAVRRIGIVYQRLSTER